MHEKQVHLLTQYYYSTTVKVAAGLVTTWFFHCLFVVSNLVYIILLCYCMFDIINLLSTK